MRLDFTVDRLSWPPGRPIKTKKAPGQFKVPGLVFVVASVEGS
jgi:hypothetical protein